MTGVDIALTHEWNGAPAPEGMGGAARLEHAGPRVVLAWDIRLAASPRIPDGAPGFLDGLWQHDVVEVFLASRRLPPGPPTYVELEAGAGGHWLALAFADVRVRAAELRECGARVDGEARAGRWLGRLVVDEHVMRDVVGPPPWRGLVTAVVSGPTGEGVHLTSSRLPGERPDFHQPREWPALA